MSDHPVLQNDAFFQFAFNAIRPRTYTSLFAGFGDYCVKPIWGIRGDCEVGGAEISDERREALLLRYPGFQLWDDYRDIQGKYDLVCSDPYVSIQGGPGRRVLAVLAAYAVVKGMEPKGVITYTPLDVAAYVKRCGGELNAVPGLLEDVWELYGTMTPTHEDTASLYGGTVIAERKGNQDLVYCAIEIRPGGVLS